MGHFWCWLGLAGNYYNWTAAIASNNSDNTKYYHSDGDVAANSICPKGWRSPLPDDEYGYMLYTQGVTTPIAYYQTDGFVKIQSSPLYFVRSGYLKNGEVKDASSGYYIVSKVFSNSLSYHMYFSSSVAIPRPAPDLGTVVILSVA